MHFNNTLYCVVANKIYIFIFFLEKQNYQRTFSLIIITRLGQKGKKISR
jgi:hypothetical protein